ncbi:SGNH/GDSL hydrolase family protein [Streptomyces botrytidirepellens]|uniref:SGNH/GDSL hydrolase family protein n=1 Tax=Streptomyces botrytidirepellens TaxID=2486417 RepID=A0A3M8X032_9ACTN|nr:SGNH/GDSL hydrolase family protein [Streptomyces botrytidirepellens]RNG34165.1 SGNH/GDSL hydrolase family protein [Streptomyces botrytidirepellens]
MPAIRLSALGDSFVEGRGDPGPAGAWYGWVPRLAELLGVPGERVRNLGTHQATTQQVVDDQLPRALANKPPVIGVIVGVNDLVSDFDPDRFRDNLATIFGRLTGMDTVVFTATYADIPANLPVPESFRALLRERFAMANEMLGAITADTGTLCLDVTTVAEWSRPEMWSADGLHPSPRGHQWFAESVAGLLERATGDAVPAMM